MAGLRAAHRYAKALFELASENNTIEQIEADIRLIDNTVNDSKDLRILLKSPVVKDTVKIACLRAIFTKVDKSTEKLFEVLIENNRIALLPQVTKAFIGFVDEMNHVTAAKVTTAVPMSTEVEQKILKKIKELTGNDATLTKLVDENLLGGFLLRINDLQYDASISSKLKNLNHRFKQNGYA